MTMFEGQCAGESFHSAPRGAEYTGAHLECLYTSTCGVRNRQEELEDREQRGRCWSLLSGLQW